MSAEVDVTATTAATLSRHRRRRFIRSRRTSNVGLAANEQLKVDEHRDDSETDGVHLRKKKQKAKHYCQVSTTWPVSQSQNSITRKS